MNAEKAYFLSKVKDLSVFNEEELNELAGDFHWEEYPQGYDIIKQGQDRNQYYVLVEGTAEVLDGNPEIGEIRVNTFGSGDAFGARSLLTDGQAPFTVRCLEKCKVLVTSHEQFTRMLIRWPKLYKKLIERMSRNLDQINNGLWEARQKEFLRISLQHSQYLNKFYGLWGSPKTTKFIEEKITELTQSREHLLLIGERGTGRQMLAWYLHKNKFGATAPFVAVDGHDLEQQLGDRIFEKTGGQEEKSAIHGNLLEFVSGGTLYISEINELSPEIQVKLAQSLRSNNNCLVVGSLQDTPEASNLIPELRELFLDLFKLTPLRERKRDIPFLAQGILEKLAKQHNRTTPSLDHEATKLLLSHNYRQGNITELIQVVERAFFLVEQDVISLEHLFFGPTSKKIAGTFDLLSFPWVEKLIKKGDFVLSLRRVTTIVFIFITAALFIVPKATINLGLFALVWGLWWPMLAMISPLLGRIWCTVCPFAYVMELVQRKIHLNHPVPAFIKKYDYLLITFLFLLIFWIEVVFDMRLNPISTGILLAAILGSAILTGIIFTRHTWCHHLCPLGGFVGMASIGAMLEVRADATVCLNKCTTYDCYKGNDAADGCPMFQHAPFVDNNLACKMCFNCVRSCNNGAVQFNLRPPGREIWHLLRINQGFVIFIGVSLGILIPINYFIPLRQLWTSDYWIFWFSLNYWGTALLAGLFTWRIAKPFKTKAASRRIKLIFSLIPIVIAGHIIYQLNFLPGADSILMSFGYKTAEGVISAINFSVLRAIQLLAALIGVVLTGFTFFMVLRSSRKKSGNISLINTRQSTSRL
ncbi:MAG: histidine kinase [Peptococcaceae bacterium BICA1-8]|nr:MAG: histidine kinase [Peptococcaceae bacterium BICA1-8]